VLPEALLAVFAPVSGDWYRCALRLPQKRGWEYERGATTHLSELRQ
jgi:hypothetical protein